MSVLTRLAISLDGYVTTPDGWPVQPADPNYSPEAYGFDGFQKTLSAVLMGHTTFEPALDAPRWPWPDLDVFVLGSHRPEGTPGHVVTDSDPQRLLEQLPREGDVHLVGGPKTLETFRALGALDKLGLIVVPVLVGDGMRLTPSISTDAGLTLDSERALPGGLVEIVYNVRR